MSPQSVPRALAFKNGGGMLEAGLFIVLFRCFLHYVAVFLFACVCVWLVIIFIVENIYLYCRCAASGALVACFVCLCYCSRHFCCDRLCFPFQVYYLPRRCHDGWANGLERELSKVIDSLARRAVRNRHDEAGAFWACISSMRTLNFVFLKLRFLWIYRIQCTFSQKLLIRFQWNFAHIYYNQL